MSMTPIRRPSIAMTPRRIQLGGLGGDIRRRLDLVVAGGEDVGDAVDQQAGDLMAELDDDDGVARGRLGRRKAEPHRQIDDRQHDAAQIDDSEHEHRGVRQRRRRRPAPDFAHRGRADAKFLEPILKAISSLPLPVPTFTLARSFEYAVLFVQAAGRRERAAKRAGPRLELRPVVVPAVAEAVVRAVDDGFGRRPPDRFRFVGRRRRFGQRSFLRRLAERVRRRLFQFPSHRIVCRLA